MGADLATLTRLFQSNGAIPLRLWPAVAALYGSALGRLPFSLWERAVTTRRLHRAGDHPPPVFILGHWRNGTTHLYNVLSKSPRFAFVPPIATGLPWNFLVLGRMLRGFLERQLPDSRYIDNVAVAPDSPQEDEIPLASMTLPSFYHGLYFPQRLRAHFDRGVFFDGCSAAEIDRWQRHFRLFLDKIALDQPGRVPLVKNPVYTARVAMLHRIWPQARFIHIMRDPRVVFESTRNFYAKLLPPLAFQDFDQAPIETLILETYPRMMDRLNAETAVLPAHQFVDCRFERFEQAPLAELERIYERLDLGDFGQDKPHFERYLETVRSYRKNRYRMAPEGDPRVQAQWERYIAQWQDGLENAAA